MVIPRVGMEVVVEFLEGDPDKPLVTGCVYNGKNKVPYELPKHKTRSTFQTKTHQGVGFNELRFEDKKDEEEIFVHAQRDMNVYTKNHRSELTENNYSIKTAGSKNEVIEKGSFLDVQGAYHIEVGNRKNTTVFMEMSPDFESFSGMGYKMDEFSRGDIVNAGDYRVDAASRVVISVGHTYSVNANNDILIHSAEHATISALKRMSIQARRLLSIVSKARISIRAEKSISLSNLNSSLKFDEAGNLKIRANSVSIESIGDVRINGSNIHLN